MDVQKHLEKAEEQLKRRNYDYALNLLRQLLLLDPNNVRARKGYYQAALRRYDRKHPGGRARKGLTLPGGLGVWLLSGGKKDPKAVMAACDRLIASHPRNPELYLRFGRAAAQAGCLQAAALAFEQVLTLEPQNLDAAKALGRLYQRLGQIEQALAAYDRALQIHPGDQEAIKARKDLAAEAALKGHGYDRAESARDLVKDREEARELDLLERVVRGEAELAEVIQRVRERVAAEPQSVKWRVRLGELLEQKGEWDEAEALFRQLAEEDPTNFDYRERVGDIRLKRAEARVVALEKAGDPEAAAARRELEQLTVEEYAWRVEAHPTDLPQRFRYGEALYRVGRYDEAIAEFQKTVKDPRKRLDSLVMMANAFLKKGMLELAANQLRRALEVAGEGTRKGMEIRYTLGRVLEEQGKREEARAHYLAVYERDIGFRDVRARLEALERERAE